MTYLTRRDRDHLKAFRDGVAQVTVPCNIAELFRERGLLWQSSVLATSVAEGLAKVCLCMMKEPITDDGPAPDLWLAAVVTEAPTPAPGFAEEVQTIFELTCPDDFKYRCWLTYFKPLPAHQQAWVFCTTGMELGAILSDPDGFAKGQVIEFVDRIHPPLVRSELLECRVGLGAGVLEEEVVYVNERYNAASEQMYYEMLESADAVSTVKDVLADPEEDWGGLMRDSSPQQEQKPQPHLFRWFDLWRRRSSLN